MYANAMKILGQLNSNDVLYASQFAFLLEIFQMTAEDVIDNCQFLEIFYSQSMLTINR